MQVCPGGLLKASLTFLSFCLMTVPQSSLGTIVSSSEKVIFGVALKYALENFCVSCMPISLAAYLIIFIYGLSWCCREVHNFSSNHLCSWSGSFHMESVPFSYRKVVQVFCLILSPCPITVCLWITGLFLHLVVQRIGTCSQVWHLEFSSSRLSWTYHSLQTP